MKRIILLSFGLLSFGLNYSQESEVEEKLKIWYADEKYPKCADKAIGYLEGKYKKDPVPYIYASMACLRISQNNDYAKDFPKAFKDALSYAGKYGKKDPSAEYYEKYIGHFEEIKEIVAEEIDNFLLEDDKKLIDKALKNSISLLKSVNDMDPNDKGAQILRGYLELHAKNSAVAKPILKEYIPMVKSLKATRAEMPPQPEMVEEEDPKAKKKKGPEITPLKPFEEMTAMEQRYLRMGLMYYARFLHSKGKIEEAKEIIEIGKPYFYNKNELVLAKHDPRYKEIYNKING